MLIHLDPDTPRYTHIFEPFQLEPDARPKYVISFPERHAPPEVYRSPKSTMVSAISKYRPPVEYDHSYGPFLRDMFDEMRCQNRYFDDIFLGRHLELTVDLFTCQPRYLRPKPLTTLILKKVKVYL